MKRAAKYAVAGIMVLGPFGAPLLVAAQDAPPAVAVVPPDPDAPAVAVVPPPVPGAPPAIAVVPPDATQLSRGQV